MITPAADLYKILDPSKVDAKFINDSITNLRRNWRPLVDSGTVIENKSIIFSQQSMEKIRKLFKDKEFLKDTEFLPLGIWNKIVNIIVEEITKTPPKVELTATDPTALSQKKEDILLLKHKGEYEQDINSVNEKIGHPMESIPLDSDKFNSNVEDFEKLGLDANDPDDINFYEQSGYQRLRYEIAGQALINNVIKTGRFDEAILRNLIIDILAVLVACMQVYVDEITGEIKFRYIAPEEAYGIFGDADDGSDDICNGFQKSVTIRDWLAMAGNDFNFNREWPQLLWALNYCTGKRFTGFNRGNITYDVVGTGLAGLIGLGDVLVPNTLDWSNAFQYKVFVGYVEWLVPEATATYLAKVGSGEIIPQSINAAYELKTKKERKEYYKEYFYQDQMYKSSFLTTSSTSQWIYNWGKVYYTQIFGAFDQYARGTCYFYRMSGKSAAEISKPYLNFANGCFYRMKWAVYHSKPQKEQHFLPELLKLAKGFQRLYPQTQGGQPKIDSILEQIIKWKRENFVDIRDFPEIDGKPYPIIPSQEGAKGGIDAIALALQTIEQWCEGQIAEKIGLNDMRLAQIQNAREGYKKGQEETRASYNSTGYIYRFLQYVKERCATTTLNYTQDIIKFKDSVPYKWLQTLMGEEDFGNLKLLEKFAPHRYGIFMADYNTSNERARLLAAADRALDSGDGRGGLTIGQWYIVTTAEDIKKGFKLLDFLNLKAKKKERKEKLQDSQMLHQNQMELQKLKNDGEDRNNKNKKDIALIEERGFITSAQLAADAKRDVKQMTNDAEPQKQESKARGAEQVIRAEKEIDKQEPLPITN